MCSKNIYKSGNIFYLMTMKKVKLSVSLISHIFVDPIMMYTDTLLNFIFM